MNNNNHKKKTGPHIFQGNMRPTGPPPPFGVPPSFGPPSPFEPPSPFGPPLHFGLPLPITREGFKEMKFMMILMILSNNPDGITGYKIQKCFQIPRGNLLRTLDELEEKDYLSISDSVLDGRAHKFFIITKKGKKYLNKLRKKWETKFSMMPAMGPPSPEAIKIMIIERIKEFQSKEDAIDFFRGVRSWMKDIFYHINFKLMMLTKAKAALDIIIDSIKNMEYKNNEMIIELVEDSMKKFEKEVINLDE
ncbi:MAG: hypothetical protein ACFFCM_22160 [Promethearchaeota archaeon]